MSMVPASRIELKRNLTQAQIQETAEQIKSIAGRFNVMSKGDPVVLIISSSNPNILGRIRALPHVEKVGNQL